MEERLSFREPKPITPTPMPSNASVEGQPLPVQKFFPESTAHFKKP